MKRKARSRMSPFGNALLFLLTYQVLSFLLSREDGISVTFIVNSTPHWAYFFDGYILAYSIAWLQNILVFAFYMPNMLSVFTHIKSSWHMAFTLIYNILLYFLGILVLLMALEEGISLYFIPFIVTLVLYTILSSVQYFITR